MGVASLEVQCLTGSVKVMGSKLLMARLEVRMWSDSDRNGGSGTGL